MSDGTVAGILPMLYTVALTYGISETGIRGRFCYPPNHKNNVVHTLMESPLIDADNPPADPFWIKHKGLVDYNQGDAMQRLLYKTAPQERIKTLQDVVHARRADGDELELVRNHKTHTAMLLLPGHDNSAEIWSGTYQDPALYRFIYSSEEKAAQEFMERCDGTDRGFADDDPPKHHTHIKKPEDNECLRLLSNSPAVSY